MILEILHPAPESGLTLTNKISSNKKKSKAKLCKKLCKKEIRPFLQVINLKTFNSSFTKSMVCLLIFLIIFIISDNSKHQRPLERITHQIHLSMSRSI